MPVSGTRFLVVWLCMAIAMTANGVLREVALKRFFSSPIADVMSALSGILLIAAITRVGFWPLNSSSTTASQVFASVFLVVLTVAFECALGRLVDHKSWSQLAAHYALWNGELWPLVLTFVALTPFLWGRWWLVTAR